MSGLEVLGAFDASYGLAGSAYNLLVQLRESLKNSRDVAEKLDELSGLVKNIEDVVKSIKAKVISYPENELAPVASGIIDVLQRKVDLNIEDAMAALEKLGKYRETSVGSSSSVARFRHRFRTSRIGLTAKMAFSHSITEALSNTEVCLNKALQEASNIEVPRMNIELERKLDEAICPPRPKEERFVRHFDCPELPDNVVLDFCSLETQEGRLMRKLLELREKESVHGMSAVGRVRGGATHGMGGVSKTTTLRAICYEAKVKEAFPDGICFMEFGQDAKDSEVQLQLERCIRNFGGVAVLAEMQKQSTLKGLVSQAAGWFRERAILLVCDDFWRSSSSDFGYLPLLKGLLRYAPRSKLLVSTRDQRIAEEVSLNCEIFDTLPVHGPSARNLLGRIAFGDEHIEIMERPDIQGYIETILNVCAGLQLALCMAGRALRTGIRESEEIGEALEMYACQVERDQRPDEMERGAQLYDHGLLHIVEASLIQCEQWAEKLPKKVDVQDLFRSLCVLEKQMVMPKSMLSILWGLSSGETDHIVRKFVDLGLVTRTTDKTLMSTSQTESEKEYGVRLHDLVLVLCQEMVGDTQEKRHGNIIDALKGSRSVWIGEEIPTLDEWWRLKDVPYIYGNLSRHMVKCRRENGLANLLADVRWTLRRVEVGGWLAWKVDFERLVGSSEHAESQDIRQIYEILERHWSEVLKDERWLAYYIGGCLKTTECKKKYTELYFTSILRYISRPFLLPRWKFLGPQDSRELSLLRCQRNSTYTLMNFARSTDVAVVQAGDQISVWSVVAQKELCSFSLQPSSVKSAGAQKELCSFSLQPSSMESALSCVAISATGRLIVSGDKYGFFERWDTESGEPVGVPVKAHLERVTCLAISDDYSTIVTGSWDTAVRMWNAMNGRPKGKIMCHEDVVECVAICESESMIVTGSGDGVVYRWNIETGDPIGEPMFGHVGSVSCVSVDRNGQMIVSGSVNKTLLRWDAKTGEQIGEPMCSHTDSVSCIAFSPCGRIIVSGSSDRTLRMWDAMTGEPIGDPFRGHLDSIQSVRFTGENGIIVSGSGDGTIRRWRTIPISRINESLHRCERKVEKIVFSDDGQKFVTSAFRSLRQWDTTKGKPTGKSMRLHGEKLIAINDECGTILSIGPSSIYRLGTKTFEMKGKPIFVEEGTDLVCAAVSSSSRLIATGSRDGTVQRRSAISGNAIGEAMHGHNREVTCVEFSADDEMLVTGSRNGLIIRWNSENGQQIGIPLLHNGPISCLSVSGDGMVIVSSANGHGIFRWDAVTGQKIGEFISEHWDANEIWTNDDCTTIVSCSIRHKLIRGWVVAAGGEIHEAYTLPLPEDVAACAINMNDGVAVVSLLNGAVGVCDIQG